MSETDLSTNNRHENVWRVINDLNRDLSMQSIDPAFMRPIPIEGDNMFSEIFDDFKTTVNVIFYGRHSVDYFFDRMIFSGPATILFDKEGTKTIVKCAKTEKYDYEKGALAVVCKSIEPEAFKVITRRWHDRPKKEKMALETWLTLRLGEEEFDKMMSKIKDTYHNHKLKEIQREMTEINVKIDPTKISVGTLADVSLTDPAKITCDIPDCARKPITF